jgi:hypothetical protein
MMLMVRRSGVQARSQRVRSGFIWQPRVAARLMVRSDGLCVCERENHYVLARDLIRNPERKASTAIRLSGRWRHCGGA